MSFKIDLIPGTEKEDWRTTIKIIYNGNIVGEYCDGGEPEDQTFSRDWSWVPDHLEAAYNLGKEDGYDKGFSEGHAEGWDEGYEEGQDDV